jgi:hypothetical protein
MFYYPVKSKVILDDLRRKITELEATTMTNKEKGKITDPVVELPWMMQKLCRSNC